MAMRRTPLASEQDALALAITQLVRHQPLTRFAAIVALTITPKSFAPATWA
jgi:hypothetical protein